MARRRECVEPQSTSFMLLRACRCAIFERPPGVVPRWNWFREIVPDVTAGWKRWSPRRQRDLRRRGLPEEARGARGEAEHEPEAEPVGQRGDRELLQHAAVRAARSDPLRGSRRGGARDQRVDRALLQPAPTAHDAWEREPDQLRIGLANAEAEDIINLSTESGQAHATARRASSCCSARRGSS